MLLLTGSATTPHGMAGTGARPWAPPTTAPTTTCTQYQRAFGAAGLVAAAQQDKQFAMSINVTNGSAGRSEGLGGPCSP